MNLVADRLRMRPAAVLTLALSVAACVTHDSPATAPIAKRPNILVIVADDTGWSDLGAFGGEIAAPNLDALADTGRVLTNFRVSPMCARTGAALLSGADHHRVGLGSQGESVGSMVAQDDALSAPWGGRNAYGYGNVPAGYRGHLLANALSMAELLRDGGYHTYVVGKWHLAWRVAAPDAQVRTPFRLEPGALPGARGFERSFVLVNGSAAHFAPSNPPTPLDIALYAEDARTFPAAELPRDYFSTKTFTDKLIGYIDADRRDGRPFFAYAAYTAPHWPLMAPRADIDAQRGRYDDGYEAVRARRVARMKRLGVIPETFREHPGVAGPAEGGTGPKRWSELDAAQRTRESRLMEVYAAMVANLDANVGRLLAHLKSIGAYDDTLIVFMSDNGAEGEPAVLRRAPGAALDNSLANLGRPGSAAAYGARWAEVSAAPFRFYKGFAGAEGATVAPLIVRMPGQASARASGDATLHVVDLLPTLLDAAGLPRPGPTWRGREVVPIEGVSMAASLRADGAFRPIRSERSVLADELLGGAYVMRGRWKLSRQAPPSDAPVMRRDVPWRLYDLVADRGETTDLAAARPAIVSELLDEWQRYVERVGVVEQDRVYSGR